MKKKIFIGILSIVLIAVIGSVIYVSQGSVYGGDKNTQKEDLKHVEK